MRLFVTDAGGWPDRTAHGSRERSHGYRESSGGSGGERVCNDDCTWACSTRVLRLALDAMFRACSLAMKLSRVTWGRCGFEEIPCSPRLSLGLLSTVPHGDTIS
jgi:hypothetical protein